jgi:hypothetical protein
VTLTLSYLLTRDKLALVDSLSIYSHSFVFTSDRVTFPSFNSPCDFFELTS